MEVAEDSAIRVAKDGRDYFFCSSLCKDKFLKQEKLTSCAVCYPSVKKPIFKNRLFIVFVIRFMGPTMIGILVTLALATVIEVYSEGSSPLAFEIYRQTGALGNSFVFLMAGVVTDYTEIGLLWTNVGRRTAIFLPLITVPQVIILGYLANIFLR